MTFYSYMMRNYCDVIGPEADLARDMMWDEESFPRNDSDNYDRWHRLILKYLWYNGACDACFDVFEKCWEEYVRNEHERENR